jgi:hypothetical protein
MVYTDKDKHKFESNYIMYEKETKHYYCYICNKAIIKPDIHLNSINHKENVSNLKEVEFKVYF